jgi:GTP-sensing pleiotropic transcriptional regulator CodY
MGYNLLRQIYEQEVNKEILEQRQLQKQIRQQLNQLKQELNRLQLEKQKIIYQKQQIMKILQSNNLDDVC